MATRRNVLKLIGGGIVLAATGTGALLYASAPSKSAREPWRIAGQYTEFRRRALSYALLAPNPHNRQPWLVALEGETALTLYCDLDRRLPETDPYDRQITIGCGAFLELLTQAAAAEGYLATVTPFPEGEDSTTLDHRPIARVDFVRAPELSGDPLFAHVLERRSNKEIYKPQDVPEDALMILAQTARTDNVIAHTVGNTALAETLRNLTWEAHVKEMTTPAALQESVDLMRIGAKEVAANPDGIELEGLPFTAGSLLGLVDRDAMGDPSSIAYQQGMNLYRDMAMSARAYGWLVTLDNTRIDQLNAGRSYVRMNLQATALGLCVHPWSQALQEYDEMIALYTQAHELIGQKGRLQMLFRIGYADPIIATPRRGLEAHIV